MVTSRTGTAKYRRNRAQVLREARANGVTHCPGFDDANGIGQPCGVELDFDQPLQMNSAEADHLILHSLGGTDDKENLRVLCRGCNLRRNRRAQIAIPDAEAFRCLKQW